MPDSGIGSNWNLMNIRSNSLEVQSAFE